MMPDFKDDDLLSNLKSMLGGKSKGISILEEQISLAVQLEYFELISKLKKENRIEVEEEDADRLFSLESTSTEKKEILVKLSISDDVASFRLLESYVAVPDQEEEEMARLALQQSRMLIEGSLLNESQIMISTGLGGRGEKLRYFSAFFSSDKMPFSKVQQNVLEKEIDFFFDQNDCVKEAVEVQDDIFTLVCLIPLSCSVRDLFKPIVEEANSLGVFVADHFIVTNIKKMSIEEVKDFVSNQRDDEKDALPSTGDSQ